MKKLNASAMSDEEIRHLHEMFAEKYLNDPEGIKDDPAFVREVVEQSIIRQLLYFAVLQYIQMQRRQDFGITGEERVTYSFCRLLLRIPVQTDLSWSDMEDFKRRIGQYQKSFGTITMTDEELDKKVTDFKLFLLGREYGGGTRDQINAILKNLGSEKLFFCSFKQGKRNLLFGNARMEQKGIYCFYIFRAEDMRSPYSEISIIAGTSQESIAVRRESAEMIFRHKWFCMPDHPDFFSSPEERTEHCLKRFALEAYHVRNQMDLKKIKNLFADEIMEGVLWHETGHTIIYANVLSPDSYAQSKTFYSLENMPVRIFNELLADWAPEQADGRIGPICQMIRISKENREKAERMLRVYLSDNWFYGNGISPVLCRQTDFLFSVLLPFVDKNGVDFLRLDQEYERIFRGIAELYEEILKKLTAPLKNAVFVIKGKSMSFAETDQTLQEVMAHPICKTQWSENETRDYPMFYWSNLIDWTRKYSAHTFAEMERGSEEVTEWAGGKVLELVAGLNAEDYPDMGQYVQNKLEIFFNQQLTKC